MTQPVQEVTPERAQAATDFRVRQLARRPPLISQSCCPITFRAAIQSIDDPEADRVHYVSGEEDNVYFDTWDTTFDTTVFDIGLWDFTDPLTGIPSIAGISLKQPGIYAVKGQFEADDFWNGVSLASSNYDDGRGTFMEHADIVPPDGPFLADSEPMRVDHWRFIFVLDWEADADNDEWDTESDCEIIFAQSNHEDILVYGCIPAGKDDGVGGTTPNQDLWIPGGYDGALGTVPHMLVIYFGHPLWDDDWPLSFPPFAT